MLLLQQDSYIFASGESERAVSFPFDINRILIVYIYSILVNCDRVHCTSL